MNNRQVRISKRFTIEMAHALEGHDGLCAHIHGHSYKLVVTLKGEPLFNPGSPKDGMVMDYADLKDLVHEKIVRHFDHALVLKDSHPVQIESTVPMRILRTSYQPTCENLVLDFVQRIESDLPPKVLLHSIKLWETEANYATWVDGD